MDDQLDQLELELRDLRMHLAAWPNDKHALEKLSIAEVAIRRAKRESAPPMSHMRPKFDWSKVKDPYAEEMSAGLAHHTRVMAKHLEDQTKALAKAQLMADQIKNTMADPYVKKNLEDWVFKDLGTSPYPGHEKNFVLPDAAEMHARTRKALADEEAAKPRYTFGEDYEMDQRWLAAERDKVAGLREDARTLQAPRPTAEPDMFHFPTSAFCLTGIDNVRYGKLG